MGRALHLLPAVEIVEADPGPPGETDLLLLLPEKGEGASLLLLLPGGVRVGLQGGFALLSPVQCPLGALLRRDQR